MKITLYTLLCINFAGCGAGKFQKYSYYIFAAKENTGGTSLKNATCFFYKKNGQLYLITCWHVISDIDPINGTVDAVPRRDTIYLRLKSKTTGGWFPCLIDLRQLQRDFRWRRPDVLPDVFVCKIHLPDDAEVN